MVEVTSSLLSEEDVTSGAGSRESQRDLEALVTDVVFRLFPKKARGTPVVPGDDSDLLKILRSWIRVFECDRPWLELSHKERAHYFEGWRRLYKYLQSLGEDRSIDYLKYQAMKAFAIGIDDQFSSPPDPELEVKLPRGILSRIIRWCQRGSFEALFGLLQAKKGWPALSAQRKKKFLENHEAVLTTPGVRIGEEERIYLTWAAELVFKGEYKPTFIQPSVHAHTEIASTTPVQDGELFTDRAVEGKESRVDELSAWTRRVGGAREALDSLCLLGQAGSEARWDGGMFRKDSDYPVNHDEHCRPHLDESKSKVIEELYQTLAKSGIPALVAAGMDPRAAEQHVRRIASEDLEYRDYARPITCGLHQAYHGFRRRQLDLEHHLSEKMGGLWGEPPVDSSRVIVVTEPGKFRPVTAGNPYLQSHLQPLQQYLLSCWKASQFGTMLDEDLTERVRRLGQLELEDQRIFWNSGDYKQATDYLSTEVTEHLVTWLINHKRLPLETIRALETVGGGLLLYPTQVGGGQEREEKGSGGKGKRRGGAKARKAWKARWQKSGQLMGHVLSFPLLCVANLSTFLRARYGWVPAMAEFGRLEKVDAKTPLERAAWRLYRGVGLENQVIINGDDILFRTNHEEFVAWRSHAKSIGLSPSPGKNYLSDRIALINNQLFTFSRDGAVRKRGYLNQKLVYNIDLKGSADGVGKSDVTGISGDLNKMFDLYPKSSVALADAMRCRPALLPGMHWFVPTHRGGIGIDAKWNRKPLRFTFRQRKYCAATFLDPTLTFLYSFEQNWEVFNPFSLGLIKPPRRYHPDEPKQTMAPRAYWFEWFSVATSWVQYCSYLPEMAADEFAKTSDSNARRTLAIGRLWGSSSPVRDEKKFFEEPEELFFPITPALSLPWDDCPVFRAN